LTALDREVVRLLMMQVRDEQNARQSLVRAMLREEVLHPEITDEEVDARINQLQEVARIRLTKQTEGSKM